MRIIDPVGVVHKERRRRSFWISEDEREYLRKQLEIYRARQITKEKAEEDSSTEERAGDNHE